MISNLTLFTDASHDRRTGNIGGGYWAVFDGGRVCGMLRRKGVPNNNEAEVRVACGAIERVLRKEPVQQWRARQQVVQLILVVDAETIRHAFELPNSHYHPLTARIRDILQQEGILLKINHVKAHTNGATPRDWVNRWCDKHARVARRSLTQEPVVGELNP